MSVLTLDDLERFRDRPRLSLDGCDSLAVLSEMPQLEFLSIQHFPKVTSLEPLRSLSNLRYLSLSTTTTWDGTGRHLSVDSFEPLATLKNLEILQILAVIPKRGRLEPLSSIASLRRVSIGNTRFYQLEDFAALSIALPNARSSLLPVCQMNFVSICRRCQKHPLLCLEGAKPRTPSFACPLCDKNKINSHLERWNQSGGLPHFPHPNSMGPADLIKEFGNPYAK